MNDPLNQLKFKGEKECHVSDHQLDVLLQEDLIDTNMDRETERFMNENL